MPDRPSLRSIRSEHSTAAAPPSLTGEHIGRVSGHETRRAASTSSMVKGLRNWAFSFSTEC